MNKVLIEDIEQEPNKTFHYEFDGHIDELNCNIRATLDLKSLGDFIEVFGHAEGITTLVCDRCLNEYEYNIDIDIDETFAKTTLLDEYGQELELKNGQFVTDLCGAKEIDIYDLLYQSVILSLPNKKVCGINCKGDMFVSDENFEIHDDRMDIFKSIQIERKN